MEEIFRLCHNQETWLNEQEHKINAQRNKHGTIPITSLPTFAQEIKVCILLILIRILFKNRTTVMVGEWTLLVRQLYRTSMLNRRLVATLASKQHFCNYFRNCEFLFEMS